MDEANKTISKFKKWIDSFKKSTEASQKFVETIKKEHEAALAAIKDQNWLYSNKKDSIKKLKMALKKATEFAK